MGPGARIETIPELVRILSAAFLPSDCKAVEKKLMAREERLNREVDAWRTKYEAMRRRVDELETPAFTLEETFVGIMDKSIKILNRENVELKRLNQTLKDKEAAQVRELQELGKRLAILEARMADGLCPDDVPAAAEPTGPMILPELKRMMNPWELVFSLPRPSRPAAQMVDEGEVFVELDDGEVPAILSDQNENKSGPEKGKTMSGSLSGDNGNERKRRKIEAGSYVREVARSYFGTQQDPVLLEKCQRTSNTNQTSDKVVMDLTIERETFTGQQHKPEVFGSRRRFTETLPFTKRNSNGGFPH